MLVKKAFSRDDYFLVKGYTDDKDNLRKTIESFARNHIKRECGNYGNYTLLFYEVSENVNEEAIANRPSEYRYRIFEAAKYDYRITTFSCWNSVPDKEIEFDKKYIK